jgi:hypothetical protein
MNEPQEMLPDESPRGIRTALGCFGAGLLLACVVAAIAIPNIQQARRRGGETPPIGALKTIATSESIFREGDKDQNGALDYASLAQLSATQLVDEVLGSGTKHGYLFRAAASVSYSEFVWFATATPVIPRETGDRYFCTNHAAVIFYTTMGSFALNTTDCEIPASAAPVGK